MSAAAPTGDGRRRVRTPTILQMEAAECGAASLAIVLAHHGRWIPLEQLRTECGVSRDGSKASNVVRAAKAHGMDAKGLRITPRRLAELPLPLVVFWEFNHFLVVEGYSPKGVHVNDPARGPYVVSWAEFDSSFTGIALTMVPGDGFARHGSEPSVLAGLRRRMGGARGAIALCLIAGLGLLVPGVVVPAAVRIFVNEYLEAGQTSWLDVLVVVVAVAAVVQVALTWLQQITLLRLSTKLAVSMSTRFFEHLLRLPIAFFGQRYAGLLVTRVQVNDELAALLSSQLAAALLGLVTAVLYLVMIAIYSWSLALVTVVFSAGNIVALRYVARRQRDANRLLVQDLGKLTATAASGLADIETLKATSQEDTFFMRFAGQQARALTSAQVLGVPSAALASLPTLLGGLGAAGVLAVGALQVMDGTLSLGTLAAIQLLVAGFNAPLTLLVGFGATLQQTAGSLASVDDVLDYPTGEGPGVQGPAPPAALPPAAAPAASSPTSAARRARLSGAVELAGVTFGYAPLAPPLLDDLTLRIEPGQRIAVVGTTGSGKSTVARVAAGLYRPWSGRVLLDGIERETLPRDVVATSVALVDQEIRLFEGSVRDNLTLWDETIADEAVWRAAKDAAIHDDIMRREGGYERRIESGGGDWSGGQRQRLEIARALAGDPALVILDEATSALDPESEAVVTANLLRIAKGRTMVIVS
ncbi:MAG TPA: NHLP family bacteriocin export ABC transporter peptidase/permease/ATPase subunit, partial [Conexibacter sp.]|nr:NHLP family bacteriocin export ABC transporter peptidase/permease/ATPase subunit [Conexibacter sp.]